MQVQLVQANHPSLDANLLKTNSISWAEFQLSNPLNSKKEFKKIEKDLHIKGELPFVFELTESKEPITLDISSLFDTIEKLEKLIYPYRYPTPSGLAVDTSFGSKPAEPVTEESGLTLRTRTNLIEHFAQDDGLEQTFWTITPKIVSEIGIILSLLRDHAVSVKQRMTLLATADSTVEKRAQVKVFIQIEQLLDSNEIRVLSRIHDIISGKKESMLDSAIGKINRPGGYFFLNLQAKFFNV